MFEDLYECYRILEVEPGATLDEVKSSYRELVKVWHPDRFSHDPKLREKAVEKLKKVNDAYERICKAGESFRSTAPPRDDQSQSRRESGAASAEYTYERARHESAPEPPPPPPARSQRERWRLRLLYGGPLAGVAVCALLIYAFYPQPEPRFLIEIPTDPIPELQKPAPGTVAAPVGGTRRAPRAAPPTFALPTPKIFGVGSSKEEVIEAQGPPDRATDTLFVYGTSDVYFEDGKVKSWRNGHPRLKVKIFAAPNLGGREYFTIGSSKDQVIHAQGTPDSFTETSFTYGTSKVYFENGKVKSWDVRSRGLNVLWLPKGDAGKQTLFTIGSTKDEVLAAQGTPDAFTETEFSYGTSRVYFNNGRVRAWHNRKPVLNVKPPA